MRRVVPEPPDDLLGDAVGLDVDLVAFAECGEGGFVEGGGDEGDGEARAFGGDVGDGEGDAVDADAALGGEELHDVWGWLEDESPVLRIVVDFEDAGEAVDVALDDVTAEEGVGAAGAFEVDV